MYNIVRYLCLDMQMQSIMQISASSHKSSLQLTGSCLAWKNVDFETSSFLSYIFMHTL